MGRNRKSKYDYECFDYVGRQFKKDYNYKLELDSYPDILFLFNHSLNDKSLQVMGIHDLNNGKSNISKLYLE